MCAMKRGIKRKKERGREREALLIERDRKRQTHSDLICRWFYAKIIQTEEERVEKVEAWGGWDLSPSPCAARKHDWTSMTTIRDRRGC